MEVIVAIIGIVVTVGIFIITFIERRFNKKFEKYDALFEKGEKRMENIETNYNSKFEKVYGKLDKYHEENTIKLDKISESIGKIEKGFAGLIAEHNLFHKSDKLCRYPETTEE